MLGSLWLIIVFGLETVFIVGAIWSIVICS